MNLRDCVVLVTQKLYWVIMGAILRFFLRLEIKNKGGENLSKLQGPLIIIANHSSWLDPFLIGRAFPFRSSVFPIYYATWYAYYWKFLPIVWPLGSFPVKKKSDLSNLLQTPLHLLERDRAITIFPEGRRQQKGRRRRPRRGAAWLAFNSQAPLLPVAIRGNTGLNPISFLLRKKRVTLHIGKRFTLDGDQFYFANPGGLEHINKASEMIARRIRELS